ncbi:MAG: phytochelatin synthase family protein [Bdellovibrionota bacterium]
MMTRQFATFTLLAVLVIGVYARNGAAAAKYGPNATALSKRTNAQYFKSNDALDFWTLIPFYLPQTKAQQCSAANFAMVLNAAHSGKELTSGDELITIESLLSKYSDKKYEKAMSASFVKLALLDRSEVVIRRLTEVLVTALKKTGLYGEQTKVELITIEPANKAERKTLFREHLLKNEKSSDDYLILNLMQGRMTGDPEGGAHIITVGAYDETKGLVLILDPDRQWYEPYWVPEEVVFEAMADPKSDGEKPGWIYLKVR